MAINRKTHDPVTVILPRTIYVLLKKEAERQQRSMSQIGEFAIIEYLNRRKRNEKNN